MAYNEKLFPGSLRIAALIALLAGGAGSVVLVLRAGQRTPAFLLAIMVVWVLAPLAACRGRPRYSPDGPFRSDGRCPSCRSG
jgi:hypothetical protein